MENQGLSVSPEMKQILARPGYLRANEESVNLRLHTLPPFAFAVFAGDLDWVKEAVERDTAPDLKGTETAFELGYASLIVLGAHRVKFGPPGTLRHLETLQYLFSKGLPVDVEDIVGYTALHHTSSAEFPRDDLTRCLLQHGANVNHQNRYGEIPLLLSMQMNLIPTIEILMEYGADVDLPDADGVTARRHFLTCGPQVTAAMRKWIRKREGGEAPRAEKCCDVCGKMDASLKNCGRCKVARYCSSECQTPFMLHLISRAFHTAKAWPSHKKACQSFSTSNTVTLKPDYDSRIDTIPTAAFARRCMGYPPEPSSLANRPTSGARTPKNLDREPKTLVIKVQVPDTEDLNLKCTGNLLVYNKKRDFACTIRRCDAPADYDRLSLAEVEKGTAPDLMGTETPFKLGYASLAILGAQRVRQGPPGGLPPDVEDIVGLTALHHASTSGTVQDEMIRCLLEHGANVNHRNRYGEISLLGTMHLNLIPTIDILMEYDVDIDIPDLDGFTARNHFLVCGPQVTAAMTKWIRKREGKDAPRAEKSCDACGKTDSSLKNCGRCRVARYCSSECQVKAWPSHKTNCRPFCASNTVTLTPYYDLHATPSVPNAELTRQSLGYATQSSSWSSSRTRTANAPKNLDRGSKTLVIKVQVPYFDDPNMKCTGNLLVYTKKRDFACMIRRSDAPTDYDLISEVVRTKGVGGKKAYFAAELESKDKLVVKVSDVLAEQPW
ncbi:hypothetical protein MSAN_01170900 [Mycena sanguinolenta]|uniref:MYND-type domain-containing protein n=1 Tax=Mycena sanguinolenta TaxID=230812 RepID=A0A8H6YMF3_9AGAR|nr:hypothetical protein MSAN_01170900 [Mycena sanguinolenta]